MIFKDFAVQEWNWFEAIVLTALATLLPIIFGAFRSHMRLQSTIIRVNSLEAANVSLLALIAKQETVFEKQLLALGLREDGRHMEIKAWMVKLDDKLDHFIGDFRELRGQLGYAKQEDSNG